ncbi:flagellin [Devosia sp. ZB163]|uniref:flagellin N-terminal helical domain-containing protein n=1 Tax=Devosia sp. ZB163 TaxID=3025938 RepID=UPI002360F098|nr:flagellin [Devosia sp. ZB163]MDC9824353.1 flagellin [Devosia sp. ZB163]
MPEVNLSKAVRSNLLSLQSTAAQMAKTQERLATGLKVNTALDNPTNFFTAASLNSRASDMANLLDSMGNGIKTIEAADNGLTSIVKTVETMQSSLRQARQDKSFKTSSYSLTPADITTGVTTDAQALAKSLTVSGGAYATGTQASVGLIRGATATAAIGAVAATVDMNEAGDGLDFSIAVNGGAATPVTIRGSAGLNQITVDAGATSYTMSVANGAAVTRAELVSALNGGFAAVGMNVTAGLDGSNNLTFTGPEATDFTTAGIDITAGVIANGGAGTALTLANFGFAAANPTETTTKSYAAKTVDQLVSEINAPSSAFVGKVRASNDNGKLRLENQSTVGLDVDGVTASGTLDGSSSGGSQIDGNTVRRNLVTQFNELRDQLDKFSDDASFNGINLLRGDKLKLTFNETGTSTIDIQAKNEDGDPISVNNTELGIDHAVNADFDSDTTLDARLEVLSTALLKLRSLASSFGSNLSIVQNRTDFTKNMINTLETGAANLTLADTNEEAANLLALQTRQQLSSTALSMASQADQAVLRLF